jgi:hypothetical protein
MSVKQYARLVSAGGLERPSAGPPDMSAVRRARIVGTLGLTCGLGIVSMIVIAVLRHVG